MVKHINIGVLGFQGAISEHISSLKQTLKEYNIKGKVVSVINKQQIDKIDALIIPGGESTTISRALQQYDLYTPIEERIVNKNLAIMGTCSGCIVLASEVRNSNNEIRTLNAINMTVERNAFGRQRESFEQDIEISDFLYPYTAIFIRAPLIKKVWGGCKVLAKIDNNIVMVQQENILSMVFHPELTQDLRIHKLFLEIVKDSL